MFRWLLSLLSGNLRQEQLAKLKVEKAKQYLDQLQEIDKRVMLLKDTRSSLAVRFPADSEEGRPPEVQKRLAGMEDQIEAFLDMRENVTQLLNTEELT